jgi:NAD(P)-dependent dehydrogenase (short-subunit alcohol dehydrogenase family)
MPTWTADDIGPQTGRRVIVTGATNGLGYETARQLARHGAHVIATGRDAARGAEALARLRADTGSELIEFGRLDLADLDSVREFATAHVDRHLDLLINNAGVMMVPRRELTAQGFECQFGTNHLGHYALTLLLLPALLRTPGSRIVTVSSDMHETRMAAGLDLDDLQFERGYRPMAGYARSKLANALFAVELDRRLRALGADVLSVAANPGFTRTNLAFSGPRSGGTRLWARLVGVGTRLAAQPVERGALPQLYAATAPAVRGGEYYAFDGFNQQRGHPARREFARKAHDRELAAGLWAASERLTGVAMPAGAP